MNLTIHKLKSSWGVYLDNGTRLATFRREVDAKLFCSAPDMLEALEDARDAIVAWGRQESSRDNTAEDDALIAVARVIDAAIAKAKGG